MKPGSRDVPVQVMISGAELRELKKLTWSMAEAFGLDDRIEAYQGKRPIGLHRWDLDCLVDVLDIAVKDRDRYSSSDPPDVQVLGGLLERLRAVREEAYAQLERRHPPGR